MRESSAFDASLDPHLCGDDGKHSLFRGTIYKPGSGDGRGKIDGFMAVN